MITTFILQPLRLTTTQRDNRERHLLEKLIRIEKSADIGTYEMDLESRTWKGSPNFIALLNLDPKPSYTLAELEAVIHPDDLPLVSTYLKTGIEAGDEFSFEYRFINRNARISYMYSTCTVYRYTNGEAYKIIAIDREITPLKQLQQKLEEVVGQSELKSKIIAMASHEFRNVLGNINTSIELAERYTSPENPANIQHESACRHFKKIRRNIRNLVDIVEEFLSFSKARNGALDVNPVKFDTVKLIEDMVDDMGNYTVIHKINYIHQEEKQEIVLDRNLLKICVNNLLNNAIKYSPNGGVIDIYSEVNTDVGMLYISVKDNGIGIPESAREHIFDEFYRADNVNQIRGTGLGLNMTKRLLNLMDGEISFISSENKGTTFLIKIPVA